MNHEALIRLVDRLEDRPDGPVTIADVEAAGGANISAAIADHVLLVDNRARADGTPVTLCRLNRRHPAVVELTAW